MSKYNVVTADIAAENTFSVPLTIKRGTFELALAGTWSATVVVQKKYSDEEDWYTSETTFTSNGIWIGENETDDCQIRFGCLTGGYASGSVEGHLAQTVD